MQFTDKWLEVFGQPEVSGSWFIWGDSGNGKTTFTLQLCKYLTNFGRVAYNSMEEGDSESMRLAFLRCNMEECKRRIVLVNEPISELKDRLRAKKSPRIIVIDSVQFSHMSYKEYCELCQEFRNVLFIIISHAEGKQPADKRANSIRYHASVKIFVEGYRAFITSRYSSNTAKAYDIWEEQAEKFHSLTT